MGQPCIPFELLRRPGADRSSIGARTLRFKVVNINERWRESLKAYMVETFCHLLPAWSEDTPLVRFQPRGRPTNVTFLDVKFGSSGHYKAAQVPDLPQRPQNLERFERVLRVAASIYRHIHPCLGRLRGKDHRQGH